MYSARAVDITEISPRWTCSEDYKYTLMFKIKRK